MYFSSVSYNINQEITQMCISQEQLESDELICPTCFELESPVCFSRIATPGNTSPKGAPKCARRVCEACLIKMFFAQLNDCPLCRTSWKPYFGDLKRHLLRFTDCTYQTLFYDSLTDGNSEYANRCRYLLKECGREYCLTVLCDDTKRAVYNY